MQKAHWARVVLSPLLFLLLLSVFPAGCATPLTQAEKHLAAGTALEQTETIDKIYLTPDENARKKIALAMNAINKNDFSCSTVQATLKDINANLHVSHAIKVQAGYLLVLMQKMEMLQKEVDTQLQKNAKCTKAYDDLQQKKDAMLKEKEEIIAELEFKINTLTETYTKTEKRRKKTP